MYYISNSGNLQEFVYLLIVLSENFHTSIWLRYFDWKLLEMDKPVQLAKVLLKFFSATLEVFVNLL